MPGNVMVGGAGGGLCWSLLNNVPGCNTLESVMEFARLASVLLPLLPELFIESALPSFVMPSM